jgi:hypothetical protein
MIGQSDRMGRTREAPQQDVERRSVAASGQRPLPRRDWLSASLTAGATTTSGTRSHNPPDWSPVYRRFARRTALSGNLANWQTGGRTGGLRPCRLRWPADCPRQRPCRPTVSCHASTCGHVGAAARRLNTTISTVLPAFHHVSGQHALCSVPSETPRWRRRLERDAVRRRQTAHEVGSFMVIAGGCLSSNNPRPAWCNRA